MYDTVTKVLNSQIQHGTQNDRIYLMHLAEEDMPEILDELTCFVNKNKYGKIFAKVPDPFSEAFENCGYVIEALVPNYFNGNEDCMFMGKYINSDRNNEIDKDINAKVLKTAFSKKPSNTSGLDLNDFILSNEFSFKIAEASDVNEMTILYSQVFESYPFPIFEREYIKSTMNNNVIYFGIWKGNDLVALSSCEINRKAKNVEMTDFAVLPEYRGYKLSYYLLAQMENTMKQNGIKTAYTIARSVSYGMNCAFARCGYEFSGMLVKNTQIGGKIEDMNVWYKSLDTNLIIKENQ